MNVYQILPTIMLGDGVSQEAIEIERVLLTAGYACKTYADSIVTPELRKKIYLFDTIPETKEDDILLYHLSTGSRIAEWLLGAKGRLVVIYHNITPAHWFAEYDKNLEIACKRGRQDMRSLAKRTEYCMADSHYNADELKEAGYTCPIAVLPIIIDFNKFKVSHNNVWKRRDNVQRCNVLFTGRVVPNKKIEDVIATFYYLQKYYFQDASLNLVGSYNKESAYYKKLVDYTKKLKIRNVRFHGHVSERQLHELYNDADVYLSLSEHEGFCIPLLEAMYFQIPVMAYDSGGVVETMRGAGIVLKEKNLLVISGIVNQIVRRSDLREMILCEQTERIDEYLKENQEKCLLGVMEHLN